MHEYCHEKAAQPLVPEIVCWQKKQKRSMELVGPSLLLSVVAVVGRRMPINREK
jgi:hypothetical protein